MSRTQGWLFKKSSQLLTQKKKEKRGLFFFRMAFENIIYMYMRFWNKLRNMGFEEKSSMAVFQKAEKVKTSIDSFLKTKK